MKYLELHREQQLLLLAETNKKTKLLEVVIEKDEWVPAQQVDGQNKATK